MRADLPTGTVTFLFTDIEGSTRLLQELGAEDYANALAEHRRVLREASERRGGVEVDTQGDAFFVAFSTAPGALDAARAAQAELELPVRMGLHTGTPLLTEEGYVGADVHRAARIAAAGHGRQVLVSTASAALVDREELRDLGEHRLKDLSAPERIFQLGGHEFPPLKTLYRTNLPVPATPFLGREHELADVRELLARDEARLLTLTGAGGSGKTRLALHAAGDAAEAYPDGVWWVPLAPLADPADVGPAAARALGGGGSLPELVDGRRLLLLLDNFEHVVEAAPEIAAVLTECPHADVLVTSRERLRVQGEHVYPVPVLERAEARRLFVTRARAAQPDFEPDELLDDLCARLDDLPLALELAAARTSLLSTAQLLERLGDRLDRRSVQVRDWAEVHRLFERERLSKTAIATRLSMSRPTVRRLLEMDEPPRYERTASGSKLDPHAEAIAAMLDQDPKMPATVILEHRNLRLPDPCSTGWTAPICAGSTRTGWEAGTCFGHEDESYRWEGIWNGIVAVDNPRKIIRRSLTRRPLRATSGWKGPNGRRAGDDVQVLKAFRPRERSREASPGVL